MIQTSTRDQALGLPNLHVSNHPLVRHKISLLADERTLPKQFREIVRELTALLLYEATMNVPLNQVRVHTPLEEADGWHIDAQIGLVPILRAGLGMVDAAVDALPQSQVWHLGIYRDENTHAPVLYYNRLPPTCAADLVIVLDPMLATAGSASDASTVLKQWGAPKLTFVGLIAAPEGVIKMHQDHPDVDIYVALLDRELDENKYIRPGLGDAGDRLFGTGSQVKLA
ncbi:MAG: uracil phosphoribosyltransferase [Thermomicrobiales bacterium]